MAEGHYTHPQSICESDRIGEGTRIWAFAHVLPGASIGRDCNICEGVFIESNVVVGDRVTVKSGVQLWDGVQLGNDVFVGPNATFTNDRFPRSRAWLTEHPVTLVGEGASIGANATILPGISVGVGAMVGAGAVVTKSVPPHAIVYGNPARIRGYVTDVRVGSARVEHDPQPTDVRYPELPSGARVIGLRTASDLRGSLSAIEFDEVLPFTPKRQFTVYSVPSEDVRGEHAHRLCHQFLQVLAGSLSVLVDDGNTRVEVQLSSPTVGLYLPPMIWGSQYRHTPNAVLNVLASEHYAPDDYIRDYEEFLKALAE